MSPDKVTAVFHSHCEAARAGGSPAAWHMAGQVLIRHTVEPQATVKQLLQLANLLLAEVDAAVLKWLKKHYPEHLRLVPPGGYAEFLRGVYTCRDRVEVAALRKLLAGQTGQAGTPAPKKPEKNRPAPSVLHLLNPSLN